MKANEGTIDRIVRAVLGVILLGLGIFAVTGWVGWVLGILGVVMLVVGVALLIYTAASQ